jgi:hypothetical protein
VEYFASNHFQVNDGSEQVIQPKQRSPEVPRSYETALWIMDQVLLENKVSGRQYRIEPRTCRILAWNTTSIAHAFGVASAAGTVGIINENDSRNSNDPLKHWYALIKVLNAIQTIELPDSLLCLPGRIDREATTQDTAGVCETHNSEPPTAFRVDPYSVSVHAPWEDPKRDGKQRSATVAVVEEGPIIDLQTILDQAGAVILSDKALQDCRREWEWDRPDCVPYTFPLKDTTATNSNNHV